MRGECTRSSLKPRVDLRGFARKFSRPGRCVFDDPSRIAISVSDGLSICQRNASCKLPSSAEEGKADALAAAGVVLVKKVILLISTILKAARYRACAPRPSARTKVGFATFSLPRSHPSSSEEGSFEQTTPAAPVKGTGPFYLMARPPLLDQRRGALLSHYPFSAQPDF